MKRYWWIFAAFLLCSFFAAGCSCDDDDDDNDADDDADDDAVDDDTVDEFPCDDYDLVMEGATEFPSGNSAWTARMIIEDNGDITGTVTPDDTEMDPYDVTGFRNDETTGYLDGSFPTPENLQGDCAEATVFNHIDFTIVEGEMTGVVTFYCGSVDEANLIGVFDAFGSVTCGDFAA